MFERFIGPVAGFAFAIGQCAEIHRMLERSRLSILGRWPCGIEDDRVADVAIVSNNFTCIANVFAVVAAETTGEIEMSDVVWVCLPISFHFGEEVRSIDPLHFTNCSAHSFALAPVQFAIVRAVEIIKTARYCVNRFGLGGVRLV